MLLWASKLATQLYENISLNGLEDGILFEILIQITLKNLNSIYHFCALENGETKMPIPHPR